MTLTQLIQDMTQLNLELSRFENQFGVKSPEFYQAMTTGELDDFDALDEYRLDFIEWLSLYQMWLSFFSFPRANAVGMKNYWAEIIPKSE